MKTRRMFLVALCGVAMLIGTSSCKKEKNENLGEKMRIEASLDGADGNTKTHLEGGKVVWNSGDAFKLFPTEGNQGSIFGLHEITGDGRTAVFEGTRPGAAPFYACYPCDDDKLSCDEPGVFKFQIPATQSGNPEIQSATTNAGPMVGYMGEGETRLTFQNAMSWLKVGLTGNAVIKRVVLTDKGSKKLNGTLTVTCNGDNAKNFSFTTAMTGGTNKLEIISDDGFQLNSTNPTYFWFQVPKGSLESLRFEAFTSLDSEAQAVRTIEQGISGGMPENKIMSVIVNAPIVEPGADITLQTSGCTTSAISRGISLVTGRNASLTTYQVGICWNLATEQDPTYDQCLGKNTIGEFIIPKDVTQEISYDITGLDEDKQYKICIYAINGPISHSNVETVSGSGVPKPNNWENGKSPLPFKVSDNGTPNNSNDDKFVYFSKGNLWYHTSNNKWQFADHQFDLIDGQINGTHSTTSYAQNTDKWIDLFGWGTSGYSHGAVCYQPWSTSNYTPSYYAYGNENKNLEDARDGGGDMGMADWGKANTIQNGVGNSWRTLTHAEWKYLLERTDSNSHLLYGEGKVGDCTCGLIILPDGWSWTGDVASLGSNWIPGPSRWKNTYTYSQWAKMEAAGAVFLPAAGVRNTDNVFYVGERGVYMTSTHYNEGNVQYIHFYGNTVNKDKFDSRNVGGSVRLVSNAN